MSELEAQQKTTIDDIVAVPATEVISISILSDSKNSKEFSVSVDTINGEYLSITYRAAYNSDYVEARQKVQSYVESMKALPHFYNGLRSGEGYQIQYFLDLSKIDYFQRENDSDGLMIYVKQEVIPANTQSFVVKNDSFHDFDAFITNLMEFGFEPKVCTTTYEDDLWIESVQAELSEFRGRTSYPLQDILRLEQMRLRAVGLLNGRKIIDVTIPSEEARERAAAGLSEQIAAHKFRKTLD